MSENGSTAIEADPGVSPMSDSSPMVLQAIQPSTTAMAATAATLRMLTMRELIYGAALDAPARRQWRYSSVHATSSVAGNPAASSNTSVRKIHAGAATFSKRTSATWISSQAITK